MGPRSGTQVKPSQVPPQRAGRKRHPAALGSSQQLSAPAFPGLNLGTVWSMKGQHGHRPQTWVLLSDLTLCVFIATLQGFLENPCRG